jgi:hypothetical protein
VGLVFGFVEWKIAREVIGPDGLQQTIIRTIRRGFFKRLRFLNNAVEIRVTIHRPFPEFLNQIATLWRVELVQRPEYDQDNKNKPPNVISIHEN